jgi:hypothetical protein
MRNIIAFSSRVTAVLVRANLPAKYGDFASTTCLAPFDSDPPFSTNLISEPHQISEPKTLSSALYRVKPYRVDDDDHAHRLDVGRQE